MNIFFLLHINWKNNILALKSPNELRICHGILLNLLTSLKVKKISKILLGETHYHIINKAINII